MLNEVPGSAEMLRFQSMAVTVALEECKANLTGPHAQATLDSLWREYKASSEPASPGSWLRIRLLALFPALAERPRWVGKTSTPQWPWFNGSPMVFVAQMPAPAGDLPSGQRMGERVLFIFCAAAPPLVQTAKGWTVKYEVVDQDPKFPW